ncbi:C-C motif chemokine 16-like isoform X1 [Saccopteryx bilineata]|uniref:C-C motif chemokine 16-like isoform X1 n=1 Tax=Saccopteryx bilineata TaxID=59482 RepID=UPI00338FDDE1
MKVSVAALSLLILILTMISAVHSQSTFNVIPAEIIESVNSARTCCWKYRESVLPRKRVVGYRKALNCNLPAIIFVTKKDYDVCANPNNKWVQDYIKDPNLPLLPPRNAA